MKKRLLITSIVMMLVVAVALSTATYAWFTSNASVTANSISMTAATNTTASIGISWTNGNYGTSITAVGDAGPFQPTAIKSTVANTVYNANDWTSATIYQSGSKNYFNAVTTGVANLGYVWHDDGSAHTDFYLNNGSSANTIQAITLNATVTGEATEFIRIAVYKWDTYNENSATPAFKLKGILAGKYTYTAAEGTSDGETKYYNANGEEVAIESGESVVGYFTRGAERSGDMVTYGTAEQGKPVNLADTASGSGTQGTDYCMAQSAAAYSLDLGGLNKTNGTPTLGSDVMQLKVVVWMDGSALNDGTALTAKASTIALNFSATQGTYSADTFGRS